MRLMQMTLILGLVGSLTAMAESRPRLSAAGKIDRSHIAPSSDYPSGVWVNSEWDDVVVRISRRGRVQTNLAVVMPNGVKAGFTFPNRLRYRASSDVYTTNGYYTVQWLVGFGVVNCQYPVNLKAYWHDEGLEVDMRYADQVTMDSFGRCVYLSQRVASYDMVLE